jgi:regulatory protein
MPGESNGIGLDFGQAYRKAADYCAIQDRCISEMQLKLMYWNIDSSYYSNLITKLTEENFLDEKRFAINYGGGKFRINGWGKLKIAASLRARSIPPELVQHALSLLGTEEYTSFLRTILEKKLKQLGGNTMQNRQKAAFFAASRGFEQGIIAEVLNDSSFFK